MHFPIVSAVITIIKENASNHSLSSMTASLVGLSWGMEPDNEGDEMEDKIIIIYLHLHKIEWVGP